LLKKIRYPTSCPPISRACSSNAPSCIAGLA
jgi:hypothetical protein